MVSLLAFAALQSSSFAWAPNSPGKASALITPGESSLQNQVLKVGLLNGKLRLVNRWTKEELDLGSSALRLVLKDGKAIDVALKGNWTKQRVAILNSPKAASHRWGYAILLPIRIASPRLNGYWRLVLRDDSDYARIEIGLAAPSGPVDVSAIDLLRFPSTTAKVDGKSQGSPIVDRHFFLGVEHPMSQSTVKDGVATCDVRRLLPIRTQTVTYSAVLGVTPKDQLRRAFLSYIESERAHPYRPFLHYNNWLDTAYGKPFTQEECLDRIQKFGEQLVRKRGVKMDSYLFDDGWDDTSSVWKFHSGFPKGFLPLGEAAQKFGAGVGVWLSPWGGYATAREQRLAYGRAHGMEVDAQGYALSGPHYYKRFHDVTMDFVTRQGVNMFKFDGTGSPDKTTPGSRFDSDFDAAIALIGDLRGARPDLFVNLTTGTWPSPFWLRYADTTWRGGADSSYAGVGTKRQQWITYRDGDTYHGVVLRGPLYPLNSLMVHGLIYASHSGALRADPGNDFADEIHSYFGGGTQLQEMYITPDLLTDKNWDDLAAAAKWSRANANTLVDTHWVGGDPLKLDVYGWASWSPRKGILVLRNPSDKPQAYSVDIAKELEMPAGYAKGYRGTNPWNPSMSSIDFEAGSSKVVDLKPFEVLVLDLEATK